IETCALRMQRTKMLPAASEPASSADESELLSSSPRHTVEFYKDDALLFESVTAFIKVGLDMHDTVLVITTANHREALVKALRPGELEKDGLCLFEAEELLTR